MALRTLLFLITNLAVVLTISLILNLLTSIGLLPPDLPLLPCLALTFLAGPTGLLLYHLLKAARKLRS